jgi:hypothetical protein
MANDAETNQARQLLAALYDQRTELGDVANDLISLFTAAGLRRLEPADDRSAGIPPRNGSGAERDGAD